MTDLRRWVGGLVFGAALLVSGLIPNMAAAAEVVDSFEVGLIRYFGNMGAAPVMPVLGAPRRPCAAGQPHRLQKPKKLPGFLVLDRTELARLIGAREDRLSRLESRSGFDLPEKIRVRFTDLSIKSNCFGVPGLAGNSRFIVARHAFELVLHQRKNTAADVGALKRGLGRLFRAFDKGALSVLGETAAINIKDTRPHAVAYIPAVISRENYRRRRAEMKKRQDAVLERLLMTDRQAAGYIEEDASRQVGTGEFLARMLKGGVMPFKPETNDEHARYWRYSMDLLAAGRVWEHRQKGE